MIDPDNDDVRCRWPDMETECNQRNNGACGPTPKARLKKVNTLLSFIVIMVIEIVHVYLKFGFVYCEAS